MNLSASSNDHLIQQSTLTARALRALKPALRATRPLMLLCVLSAAAAHAQLTTSDILGTVTDATGAVVPNAKVTVRNLDTNDVRTVMTDSSGNYIAPLLSPGHYTIRVEAPGFKASTTENLAVEAGEIGPENLDRAFALRQQADDRAHQHRFSRARAADEAEYLATKHV